MKKRSVQTRVCRSFDRPTLLAHATTKSVLFGHDGCNIVDAVGNGSSESLDMSIVTMGLFI